MADKEKEKEKDKDKKKSDAPEKGPEKAAEAKAKGGGLMSKTPVLMGGAMILEAAVLFAGFKFLGSGPKNAAAGVDVPAVENVEGGHGGAAAGHAEAADKKKPVEINVVDFKAPNKLTGKTYLFDVSIFVVAKGDHAEAVKATLKNREALIRDRMRTIIAQSDPGKLSGEGEPGLETLRRQVKWQLDEILGEGMIDEVLVPKCTPFRADL
jgi:flagellar basal body-associated protein FliL